MPIRSCPWLLALALLANACAEEDDGVLGGRLGLRPDAVLPTAADAAAAPDAVDDADPDGGPAADADSIDTVPAPAPLVRRPFGSHQTPYVAGTLPTGAPEALDGAVRAAYDRWKARYLAEGCGGHYIKTGGGTGARMALTVSEGHGYAMMVLAAMAGHDPDARRLFDGFVRVFQKFRSNVDGELMVWAIDPGCTRHASPSSAADGDFDIAHALLMADAQWGPGGTFDYGSLARRNLVAVNRSDVNATTRLPRLGDWVTSGPQLTAVRSSDLMPGHFRAFARGLPAAAAAWSASVEASYDLLAAAQAQLGPGTGLLPDFILVGDGAPAAAPPGFQEGDRDGHFHYNACRVPWRLGTDYLLTGEPRARAALDRMTGWIKAHTGGDPGRVRDGYALDGGETGSTASLAFLAPLGVAAMAGPEHQAWLDALFQRVASAPASSYYEDTLALLGLIVMTGNWWAP